MYIYIYIHKPVYIYIYIYIYIRAYVHTYMRFSVLLILFVMSFFVLFVWSGSSTSRESSLSLSLSREPSPKRGIPKTRRGPLSSTISGRAFRLPGAMTTRSSIAACERRSPVFPSTGVLPTGVFGIVEMCLALMRRLVFRDLRSQGFRIPGKYRSGHAKTHVSKTPVKGTPEQTGWAAKWERWEVLLGIRLLGTIFWHGSSNQQAATAQMGTWQAELSPRITSIVECRPPLGALPHSLTYTIPYYTNLPPSIRKPP